ncbi:MAG: hypothetical protein M0Z42_26605 [Actinomycetota bacterium]|nr:hypothetical protein [Actinomycetota bacterium]
MATAADVGSTVPLLSMMPGNELSKLVRETRERAFPAGTVLTDQARVREAEHRAS